MFLDVAVHTELDLTPVWTGRDLRGQKNKRDTFYVVALPLERRRACGCGVRAGRSEIVTQIASEKPISFIILA